MRAVILSAVKNPARTATSAKILRCAQNDRLGPDSLPPWGAIACPGWRFGLVFLILAASLHTAAAAGSELPAAFKKVGFDQRLNEQVPLDLQFTDETGKVVRLGDYFGKKPVVLVLAYYECPMLCTLVLNGLTQAMRSIPFTAGREFNVVTVSFNPRETPALAAKKKKNYIASYGRPGADEGWHFLVGKPDAIDALTKAVGFRYVYDPKQDQYIHTSGIMVLTPAGKISRYFYGIRYAPVDLRLGLVEASAEKIGSPVDAILLYCAHYDPETGKYSASILNFVRLGGVMTVVAITGMVWFLLRREARKHAGDSRPAAPLLAEPAANTRGGGP
jgi:protein SCO1/2